MTADQPTAEQLPEPLSQDELDKLVNTWAAGFVSGMTTLMLQGHGSCDDPTCTAAVMAAARAQAFVALAFSDPAFRLGIEQDAEKKWHNPDLELGAHQVNAYPAAWHGGPR
jgi:hypothetical protein